MGMLVGVAAIFLIQHFFFNPPTFDERMIEMASEMNKSCPIMVDKETRLDNVTPHSGKVIQYNYTLVNVKKEEVDINEIDRFLKTNMTNNVKTNPNMKAMRENKVTMSFSYKDKNGNFLTEVEVTPEIYLKSN